MCYGLAPLRMPPTTAPDRPVTYSNPQGTALTQIRDNVWWGERSFYPRIPGLTGFDGRVPCPEATFTPSTRLTVHFTQSRAK